LKDLNEIGVVPEGYRIALEDEPATTEEILIERKNIRLVCPSVEGKGQTAENNSTANH